MVLATFQFGVWSASARADESNSWVAASDDDVFQFVQDPGAEADLPEADTPEAELQPPLRTRLVRLQPAAARRSRFRLASVPNMFGDTFPSAGLVFASQTAFADVGLAGGARRMKIAENNKALPMDRIIFMYNHFNTALAADEAAFAAPGPQRFSVERFTIGFEKTFGDGLWSVDLRMPFTNEYNFDSATFDISGGHVGNLAVSLKRLMYEADYYAVAGGLGIDLPTGSDVVGTFPGSSFTVHNDAVFLMPYLGLLATPGDRTFVHAFAQLDVVASGNRVDVAGVVPFSGTQTDQTLLYLDASVGHWLYRNPSADYLTGLAALVELHYTSTLQDGDRLGAGGILFTQPSNRRDILNLTFGLHGQIAQTDVRVGAVFPLRDKPDRLFSSEIQVQVNRRF
jgi:hypothetical protein